MSIRGKCCLGERSPFFTKHGLNWHMANHDNHRMYRCTRCRTAFRLAGGYHAFGAGISIRRRPKRVRNHQPFFAISCRVTIQRERVAHGPTWYERREMLG